MSRKNNDVGEKSGDNELKTAPDEKEKLSRVNKRHRKEARKKRRVVIIVLLVVGVVLAVGAILDVPYINIARETGSWIGERFSSSQEDEEAVLDYLYFTHPQSEREFEGEVTVLLGIHEVGDEGPGRVILGLALLAFDTDKGSGEIYLIPESSVAYGASGQQTELRYALQEEGGENLLRTTVSNLSGSDVDYLLLLDFWETMKLLQGLQAPGVVLEEETVLVNPLNGETNYLVAGQEIRDADRLLFYLLSTDALEMWESFSLRLGRARGYLPAMLHQFKPQSLDGLQAMLSSLEEDYLLEPGTGSVEEDRRYMASMLQAYAGLEETELVVDAVPSVEVLNGCGVPELGRKVGERLAALGVPVAGTGGNAKVVVDGEEVNDFSHEVSSIIYRSEDPRVVAFARYLGILLSIESVSSEPGPGQEIILIAGKDLAD
ncbi:MAG: LytR C-terminal domain-containing protein [Actinobacteria bacterium]|nr:LytR C-terminal domain-containing protein [Actinomycetota bacterium]